MSIAHYFNSISKSLLWHERYMIYTDRCSILNIHKMHQTPHKGGNRVIMGNGMKMTLKGTCSALRWQHCGYRCPGAERHDGDT